MARKRRGDQIRYNGPEIRRLREAKGWTIEELREQLKVVDRRNVPSLPTLQRLMAENSSGEETRSSNWLGPLAAVFGVPPGQLILPDRPPSRQGTYGMREGLGLFLAWERTLPPEIPLQVASLALDLANGWDIVLAAIVHTASVELDIVILCLPPDATLLDESAPSEVVTWCAATATWLRHWEENLARIQVPKRVTVTVKDYRPLPREHGVRVVKGTHGMHYLNECAQVLTPVPYFDWRPESYWIVAADSSDPDELAFRARYDARFDQLLGDPRGHCHLDHLPIGRTS